MAAEDKVGNSQCILSNSINYIQELDRTFKKDFADCEPYVDQLYKLFRRRPRYIMIFLVDILYCCVHVEHTSLKLKVLEVI